MAASPYTVSDVMTLTAVAIGREASYKEIVELMHHWKVSAVPVLEGEGRVVGVVSEADLLPKEEFRQDDPKLPAQLEEASKADAVLAGDLMSSPAITVHPDATLAEAARIMARKRVKRLPVVNDLGMLEGVVSRSDLLKVFLRPDEEIDEEIRSAVVAGLSPPEEVEFTVLDGVVTVRGPLRDRSLVPLLARAIRAVEGVVDVRMELA
ncbi:CBS domain-containing protein [Streptomyces sp. NBC_00264]|uniref:CBS domain-containing protein n=1 Tax=unclassified Streptomyces TaxID=2593676 RepID=UPI000F5BA627|nr:MULTISPECIES: CBS domain-containing protein [unclassified Streptomyces]WSG55437.1 CBS domain-containing protein [Streptomyces sp. NBC_01732]WSX06574.1 CBS domain-containing protein [Streptomyces sp. NBC_00987]MCX5098259.1 CBS domain-containing protein [Streptomyces sp. NBC_00439]MCX5165270.1 CBS domain-containing protein [Streptomyces sp. NBC_00305]MCX5223793.1 CBS domain-containing protein [Streptomyces sp. NBC_00264]